MHETSGDIMVSEGAMAKLTCKATGQPPPHLQWRREDGGEIVIREPSSHRTKGTAYHMFIKRKFPSGYNIFACLLQICG